MEIQLDESTRDAILTTQAAIARNPSTRKRYLQLIKEVAPNATIPEIDEPARFEADIIEPLRKENATLKDRLDKIESAAKVTEIWADVRRKTGISEDDVPAVYKVMQEKGIHVPQTAAEFYLQSQRLATPRGGGPTGLQLPWKAGLEQFKGLFENRDSWARNEAFAWLRDRDAGLTR